MICIERGHHAEARGRPRGRAVGQRLPGARDEVKSPRVIEDGAVATAKEKQALPRPVVDERLSLIHISEPTRPY